MSDLDTNSLQDLDEDDEQDIFALSLINCVRERVWLYNRSDERHKDKDLVARAWTDIGEEMDMTPDKAKMRWTRLRNSYTKALARRLPKPGMKTLTKPWIYETEMEFLKDHLKLIKKNTPEHTFSNNKTVTQSGSNDSPSSSSERITLPSGLIREQLKRTETEAMRYPETVYHEKPKKPKLDEFEDIMIQYAKSLKETRVEEPLIGWFRTLLPTIKTFPPHHLVDFQISVMQEMRKVSALAEQERIRLK